MKLNLTERKEGNKNEKKGYLTNRTERNGTKRKETERNGKNENGMKRNGKIDKKEQDETRRDNYGNIPEE